MKKIVIYVRESTLKQVKMGYNLEEQKRVLTDRVNREFEGEEYEILIMEERGESAKDLERTQIKRLIPMIKNHEVDAVYILSLDRLSRSVIDTATLVDIFKESNVRLVSLQENIDFETAQGRLTINMLSAMGQWEREAISSRTKRALKEAARQGKYQKPKYPFGYQKDGNKKNSIVFKEPEASFMKEIFRQLDEEDVTVTEISEKLDAERKFNRRWKDLHKMIRDPAYSGILICDGEEFDGIIPPLISRDQQERVINKIRTTKIFAKHHYLYRGLLWCSQCKKTLKCTCCIKKGQVYLYYYCPDCNTYINERKITEQIVNEINEYGTKNNLSELFEKTKISVTKKLEEMTRLSKIYLNRGISEEIYDAKRMQLEEEISKLNTQLFNFQNTYRFDLQPYDEQRRFLCRYVERINVHFCSKSVKIKYRNEG